MGECRCGRCGHDGAEHQHHPWWAFWQWRRRCLVALGVDWDAPRNAAGNPPPIFCPCPGFLEEL